MGNKVTLLKVDAPFAVSLRRVRTKDKRVPINLNWYRNAHYLLSNAVKTQYGLDVEPQLKDIVLATPCEVTYQVFKPTRLRLDKMNVVSITSKFLLDRLVELGVIEDDNDDFIKTETILPTVHDKDNPRVEVTFRHIEESK